MDKWHYSWDGEEFGPVSRQALQQLIDEETLQAGDLVWTAGMPAWQTSGSVTGLVFPETPPPLPGSRANSWFDPGNWDKAIPVAAGWLWRHKPVLLLLGTIGFGSLWTLLLVMRADDVLLVLAGVLTIGIGGGLAIMGLIKVSQLCNAWQRLMWLQKKWESANGDGGWVQFSQDGGFLCSDGFGAKYTFHPADDCIKLQTMDDSSPILLKVVLLSEKDLAVTWDGQTRHYRKPAWWKCIFG